MLKLKFWVFIGLLFIALTPACQKEDETWQHIQETGTLKIGLDPTYPPFETADANGLYGLDIDLAEAIAADLGLQAEFVLFGYDGLYDALATKQVDVLLSALVIIPEKTRDFAYSEPYFNAGEVLVIPQGEADIQEMADLNGRTLAVELGALGHVEAISWEKKLADVTITPYTTAVDAMTAVQTGEADAALVDSISGHLFLKDVDTLQFGPQPITVEPFALVVRIEDELLLEALNRSLSNLEESGQLEEIIQLWLGS